MKKQLWVFNQFASTPETNSGAGERYYYLGQFLQNENWNTNVFCGSYNHLFLNQPKRKLWANVQLISPGLQFIWVWVTKYNPSSGFERLINWLSFVAGLFFLSKKKFGKPDVIIVSSMSMWPILNALWCRLWHRRVKIIFEIRDIWPLTPVLIGSTSVKHPVVRIMFWLEKLAYSRSDHIVSVLPKANLRISEVLGSTAYKFAWIPNAIDHQMKVNTDNEKIEESRFQIMYAGAIGAANSLGVLIETAELMQNSPVEFVLIGDGPDRIKLEKQSQHLSNIRFLGRVRKLDVGNLLASADLLFIAWHSIDLYKYGVSANKYNDYMLAKKPVLSVGSIAENPVEKAQCGLVVPFATASTIEQAIRKIQGMSKKQRDNLGQKGYDYLLKNGTYEVIGVKYLDLLNHLTA